jgi:hypothetical protein
MNPTEPHNADTTTVSRTTTELEELRARVAAQDRLIESFISENEDIHALRQRNHQLEQYVGKLLGVPGVRGALKVRRRLLGRPD